MTGHFTLNAFDAAHRLPDRWVEREHFLRRHLHLIVPELHAPALRAQRNADLLRAGWEAAGARAQDAPLSTP